MSLREYIFICIVTTLLYAVKFNEMDQLKMIAVSYSALLFVEGIIAVWGKKGGGLNCISAVCVQLIKYMDSLTRVGETRNLLSYSPNV